MTPMTALPPLIVRIAKPVVAAHAGAWFPLPLALTRPAEAAGPVRIRNIGCDDRDLQFDLDLFQQDVSVRPGETYRFTLPILTTHAREVELNAFFVEVADPPELVRFPAQLVSVGPSLAKEVTLHVEPLCAYEAGTKVQLRWQHGGATHFNDLEVALGPEGAVVAGKTALRRGTFGPGDHDEAEVVVRGAALDVRLAASSTAGRTEAVQTVAIAPPPPPPQRPRFRFLAPRRLASDQVTVRRAKGGELVAGAGGCFPVHAGQCYEVAIRPQSPRVSALRLRDIPGRIVVRKPEGESDGRAWTFQVEINVAPHEFFSRPERLDYTVESADGPLAGEIHLHVKPPRGKHVSIAAAFGLALTAQGLFALGKMLFYPDVSIDQMVNDFNVARDYPVFLSLTIPAIWIGFRALDWLMWRLRD
jgi:hypothetical protein